MSKFLEPSKTDHVQIHLLFIVNNSLALAQKLPSSKKKTYFVADLNQNNIRAPTIVWSIFGTQQGLNLDQRLKFSVFRADEGPQKEFQNN